MSRNTNWVCSLRPEINKNELSRIFSECVGGFWKQDQNGDWGSSSVIDVVTDDHPYEAIVGRRIVVFVSGYNWASFYAFADSRNEILGHAMLFANTLGDGKLLVCSEDACILEFLTNDHCDDVTLFDIESSLTEKIGPPSTSFERIQENSDANRLSDENFFYSLHS